LLRQVVAPVRWHELIETMLDVGIDTFVEIGPGRVLAGLVRSIRRSARVLPAGEPEAIEAAVDELSVAA
jgi:[acyl-carrier-protein] S-malonyltransferase